MFLEFLLEHFADLVDVVAHATEYPDDGQVEDDGHNIENYGQDRVVVC